MFPGKLEKTDEGDGRFPGMSERTTQRRQMKPTGEANPGPPPSSKKISLLKIIKVSVAPVPTRKSDARELAYLIRISQRLYLRWAPGTCSEAPLVTLSHTR